MALQVFFIKKAIFTFPFYSPSKLEFGVFPLTVYSTRQLALPTMRLNFFECLIVNLNFCRIWRLPFVFNVLIYPPSDKLTQIQILYWYCLLYFGRDMFLLKSNQVYWSKTIHLRAKTIYIRAMIKVGSNNITADGIQAIHETGHCRSFSNVKRQSISRSGRTYGKSHFPPGKIKKRGWRALMLRHRRLPAVGASKKSFIDKFR